MSKSTKEEEKKYRDLCIESYKENNTFLGKMVVGTSAISLPLLMSITNNPNYGVLEKGFLTMVTFIFTMSVYWSFSSTQKAKEGADASLSKDAKEQERGTELFAVSDAIDKKRDIAFILGMFLLVLYLLFSNIFIPLYNLISTKFEFTIS